MSGGGGANEGEIPYHLMPVAAALGMYAVGASIKALHQVYKNFGQDPTKITAEMRLKGQVPRPLKSRQFVMLIGSIVLAVLAYGYVTAIVDNSIAASDIFDPYDILQVSTSDPLEDVKKAYRNLAKENHPDKGGDATMFNKINLAYRALSDEVSRENFLKYGHPDGPQMRTLSFAMPDWLLHPTGNVALVLILLYFGAFVGIILMVIRQATSGEEKALKNSVAGDDIGYIAKNLKPDSTHLEVLFVIATTPENLKISQGDIAKADDIRARRVQYLAKEKGEKANKEEGLDLDDEGWADDEDEDEESKKRAEMAKRAEEEKAKEAKRLAAATGKSNSAENIKLEGLDDGVLGQQWVEQTLKKVGKWPPALGSLENMKIQDENGRSASVLNSRAARRNICMTMGRLNASALNSHPELLQAGAKGMIDPTYFKSTLEFRQRTGLLLEAALKIAISARSYRLAKTVIEAVSMFKIGSMTHDDKKTLAWFRDQMIKQYDGEEGIPRLEFISKDIETPDEDEIATGDTCALLTEIARPHAENFTKQKVELCRKQGIPPQVAMQTYREGWWILIRCKKIGGGTISENGTIDDKNPLAKNFDSAARKRFDAEKDENRLSCAWPFIVSNVAQKQGKVKVQFRAPATPGKYQFYVAIKSQEFLGADQEFVIEKEVVDGDELRKQNEDAEVGGGDDDGETKKTK